MFEAVTTALKTAEDEIEKALEALWVPWNTETNSGAVHWHAAGAGILQQASADVNAIRTKLESQEPPAPVEEPAPAEAPAVPETAPEIPAEAPTEVPVPVTEPAQETDTTTQEVLTVNA